MESLIIANIISYSYIIIHNPVIIFEIVFVTSFAGSFTFIMNMEQKAALIAATVPPTIYLALCFKLKSDTQIQIAAVLSVLYAFLMTGTILSIIGNTFSTFSSYDLCYFQILK